VAPHARLFAKLESRNPGGSIKDRPVARMLSRALSENRLAGGRRVLDSSSGNAGIAYAMLAPPLVFRGLVVAVTPARSNDPLTLGAELISRSVENTITRCVSRRLARATRIGTVLRPVQQCGGWRSL
jgi:cysteine synthase